MHGFPETMVYIGDPVFSSERRESHGAVGLAAAGSHFHPQTVLPSGVDTNSYLSSTYLIYSRILHTETTPPLYHLTMDSRAAAYANIFSCDRAGVEVWKPEMGCRRSA
jgi:hypothetical protein